MGHRVKVVIEKQWKLESGSSTGLAHEWNCSTALAVLDRVLTAFNGGREKWFIGLFIYFDGWLVLHLDPDLSAEEIDELIGREWAIHLQKRQQRKKATSSEPWKGSVRIPLDEVRCP